MNFYRNEHENGFPPYNNWPTHSLTNDHGKNEPLKRRHFHNLKYLAKEYETHQIYRCILYPCFFFHDNSTSKVLRYFRYKASKLTRNNDISHKWYL